MFKVFSYESVWFFNGDSLLINEITVTEKHAFQAVKLNFNVTYSINSGPVMFIFTCLFKLHLVWLSENGKLCCPLSRYWIFQRTYSSQITNIWNITENQESKEQVGGPVCYEEQFSHRKIVLKEY